MDEKSSAAGASVRVFRYRVTGHIRVTGSASRGDGARAARAAIESAVKGVSADGSARVSLLKPRRGGEPSLAELTQSLLDSVNVYAAEQAENFAELRDARDRLAARLAVVKPIVRGWVSGK